MKVLEVHEQLEKVNHLGNEGLADGEKALVREMCNVSFDWAGLKLDLID